MSEEQKATPQLDAARFKSSEYEFVLYSAVVEPNVTREQIEDPGFWSHVAAKLRPYDEIRVLRDDGTIYAKLLVLGCDRTWAKVRVLMWESLTTKDVAQSQDADFKIEWKGPHRKHCVIRASDSEIVHDGATSKADAQVWLDNYRRTVAA